MAGTRSSTIVLALGLLLMTLAGQSYAQLKVGYYKYKCGKVDPEGIVFAVVKKHFLDEEDTVSDLVRLQFHDCMVEGCDGSILLEGSGKEKTAEPNLSVAGFDIIEEAKVAIDKKCPGIVSCADIVIMAARTAAFLGGANWYNVETGRKDGHVSIAGEAVRDLPGPSIPVSVAINLFAKHGMSKEDFVVLLGCHTVGTAHCNKFQNRLYNYRNSGKSDPSMNPAFLSALKKTCPKSGANPKSEAFLDQTKGSEFKMDNAYYKRLLEGKGLLEIDQQMANNPLTRKIVIALASDNGASFAKKIGTSMIKLGRVGVILKGDVRKGTCKR